MSEQALEDLYFYNLYRGIQVEVRDPISNVLRDSPPSEVTGSKLFDILNHQLEPDPNWRIDICY